MDWCVIYIIGKLLKCICLKWACITHLDIWNTSYGQKKGQESNWQFDSRPLKVENRLNLPTSNLISIRGLHAKLWAPKVMRVPTLVISGFPLGSPRTKNHLDVGPMERRKVYYKGEGGGFPQVQAMVSLVSPNSPWLVLTLKVLQLCTNHFMLVLYRFVWVSKACQIFLVPS